MSSMEPIQVNKCSSKALPALACCALVLRTLSPLESLQLETGRNPLVRSCTDLLVAFAAHTVLHGVCIGQHVVWQNPACTLVLGSVAAHTVFPEVSAGRNISECLALACWVMLLHTLSFLGSLQVETSLNVLH